LARLGRQAQAWIRKNHHTVTTRLKRCPALRSPCRVIPIGALAMSSKAHCPQPWGERVGGVSGEPTRVAVARGRKPSSLTCSSRNGERHPGSQDAVSLRGLAEQCESWSVRLACRGLVPRQAHAPATTGVLWENEEGNVVSVRQAPALIEVTPKKRRLERGHVLHSVQRPVHVNRH
jgi:hypothetical protein